MRFPVFLFYLTAIKASQLGNNYQLDLLVTSEELPRNVRVNRYDLQLNLSDSLLGNVGPNLPRRFKGEVKIEFVVVETLSTLRLNAVNLSVHEAKLYDTTISNTTQMALDVLPSSDLIGLTAQLQVGQTYIAVINYEGQLGTEKNGFYYVAYPGENGQQKSLIATVFEPNYARQMLPCLDDLHFKAQFSLRVIAPKELAVFFNTMEMSVEHDEFNQFIVFETTPPMSTYLLALVVGEYRTTVVQTRSGIPVRAASTLEQSRYLQRAAEIGAQSVDLMEQMTGLLFSMKKLDLIDIREISLEGALEDWGAIVFSGILSSIPSSMTVEHEQDRASTIAHEVSHAWWGDMVTSDKWNEIFLHESFASFFQMRLMQQIDGDAEWIESKFVQFRETGLNAAEQSGKALISKESNFGAEIYMGGSSILRMIEATVGPQTFINALRLFLQEHAFATANHLDLIRAFEKATGNQTLCGDLTIREFLLDFFLQSYFPVVNIDLRNRDLSFSQHSPQVAANSTARWNVPIFIWNSRDKVDTMIWLLKNNSICSNDRPAFSQALSSLAVVFNHRALTYARFKYPSTLIDNILSEGVDQLDDLTLLGLLQDSALTPDGLNIFVNLMRNGKRKFGAEVAYSGLMLLSNARKLFYQTNELVLFEKLESEMVTKLYEKANWEPKTSGDRAYSNQVMREAVRWGVLDSRAKASLLWSQLVEQCASLSDLERCNSIPADLRNAVVCFGILDNQNSIEFTFAYWTRLLELAHVYTFFNNELINVESGLLCAEDPIVLERILKVAAENDRFNLISILSKPVAYNLTMRFLREAVTEKQRTSQQFVLNVLSYLAQTWNTENQRQSLQEILSTIVRNLNPKQRDFLVESLNNNIQRRNQLLRLYTRWLYDVQVLFVDDAWNQQQLRPSIQNVAYDLNLQPYIPAQELQVPEGREGTFDANSKISFVTTSSIDRLVLNSHRQMINQILATIDGETFPVRFDRDYNRTLLTVYFGRQIPPNTNVELSFEYSGFMAPTQRDQHHGVILQPYYNTITKRSSHLLTVQLSGGANPRSLLPCIDNSDYKAIWRVRIRHSRRMIALANSPVESIKPTNESEYLLTEFQPTTPTATLIFSVTVGDFQSINGRTEDGIEVRFYASEGFEYHGRVALEAAIATLDFLSKELNFRYVNMNTKLDLVAFPHFYGSMENSACIVLRDSRVLFDGMSNTLEEKRILLRLWFGDLLSIRHWREMFMGEGFAKFYESEVYEHLTGYGERFRFESAENGLFFDEENQFAIYNKTIIGKTPFLMITHDKPAALIHSLELIMGERKFKAAISQFVQDYQFGTVELEDFFSTIEKYSNFTIPTVNEEISFDVRDYMHRFLLQTSCPVLVVNRINLNGSYENTVSIRSFHNRRELQPSTFNHTWKLPLYIDRGKGAELFVWFTEETSRFTIPNDTVVVNPQRKAFARVYYDDESWQFVLNRLENIDELSRATLLTDMYAFAKRNHQRWTRLFNLMERLLINEESELLWKYAAKIFEDLRVRLKSNRMGMQQLKELVDRTVNRRGIVKMEHENEWEINDSNTIFVQLSGKFHLKHFVANAAELSSYLYAECFHSVFGLQECLRILPEHRSPVLCSGIRSYPSIEPQIRNLLQHFGQMSADDPFLRTRVEPLIEAVACVEDAKIRKYYVNETLNQSFNPFADLLLRRIATYDESESILFEVAESRWNDLIQSNFFDIFIDSTIFRDSKSHQWLNDRRLKGEQRKAIERAIERVKASAEWNRKHLTHISNSLLQRIQNKR